VDKPSHADAIVVLGPVKQNGRLDVAKQLAADGMAPNMLISVGSTESREVSDYCQHPPAEMRVECFTPHPDSTRGEAEKIRESVAENGWRKIIVVTSTYHISRARMIVKRCFDGQLLMVPANRGIGLWGWTYSYVYETSAYVKAAFQQGC
jgi:hypothetical protein